MTKKKTIFRFELHRVYVVLLCIGVLLMLVTMMEAQNMDKCLASERDIINYRDSCLSNAQLIIDGSTYMTEQAWRYVISRDRVYLENYWYESDVAMRRDNSLSALSEIGITDKEKADLESCFKASNDLMVIEIHAMKLVATALGYSENEMPKRVRRWVLTDKENDMTPEQKIDSAISYIYGQDYANRQAEIVSQMQLFYDKLNVRINNELNAAIAESKLAQQIQTTSILLLITLFVAIFVVFYFFVIKPIILYQFEVKEKGALSPTRSKELNRLAAAFNEVSGDLQKASSRLAEQNKILKRLSETDYLTTLANRYVLDDYAGELIRKGQNVPYSMFMIDIDHFKSFNDTYGHYVGDMVLKEVAHCISEFSSLRNGFAARYGGEEFVLIVPIKHTDDVYPISKILLNEISSRRITIPSGEEVSVQVSIGSDILAPETKKTSTVWLKNADMALYAAKENGRNRHIAFSDLATNQQCKG